MNGDESKPATNKSVISIVVCTLAFNATVGMLVLSYCLVFKVEPNVALLTVFVGIVNFLFGAVGGMLIKTSPTETTKTSVPTTDNPLPVKPITSVADPVHTEEAGK